uniref:cysteine proteinase inhibitor 5-like n=1 Tax=Erigeron canadensis TaxID=72917 RepID=UPI001CB89A28|nr:cysteine proteinase inhibitor 5-like [Erigeron canadensis]
MDSSYHFLLATLILIFPVTISVDISPAPGGEGVVDDWTPIKNLSDTRVVDIGKFAVARHNFQAKTQLAFDHLVNGKTQSQARTEYNLTIAAKDGNADDTLKNYVAIVFDRPNENFMHLVSFRGPERVYFIRMGRLL